MVETTINLPLNKEINVPKQSIYGIKKLMILFASMLLLFIALISFIILPLRLSKISESIIPVIQKDSIYDTFETDSFEETKEIIINPDQGFYRPIMVFIEPKSFKNQTNNAEQLYHLRCDISQFSGKVNKQKDIELTDYALEKIDEYLSKIKSENRNAVIRFSYDPSYGGNKNIEPSLEMIEKHIKQLGPILNKHIDTLVAIEAGMLGPYGEMHSSDIASEENKAKVFEYWLDNTKEIPILARTPKAIFTYFGRTLSEMEKFKINSKDKEYRLGLFNDGYLGTETDYGTYKYDRKREVNWLSTQNDHLPYGGETCALSVMSNLEVCIPEMFLLSLSYLNLDYHKDVIEKWKNLKYNSTLGKDSLYFGLSGFDYIKTHLGYRFVIKSMTVSFKTDSDFNVILKIKNVGFGNLNKKKKLGLIFTSLDDKIIMRSNDIDEYKGSNEIKISGSFSSGKAQAYKVYFLIYGSIENNIVYYPIQFANKNIYNSAIKANFLFLVKDGKISQ